MKKRNIGIVVFDDVEVLDFCGPFEVFSITRLANGDSDAWVPAFKVLLVAEKADPVTTVGGMQVVPMVTFADCPPLDVLLIPGGWGTRREAENAPMLDWVRARTKAVELTTSVCTGALVLGAAGLLDGRRATTHWQFLDRLREAFPAAHVIDDEHVVEDGNLITSAGISAGIDMALRVVARYCGVEVARATARHMEYPYSEDNKRRVEWPIPSPTAMP